MAAEFIREDKNGTKYYVDYVCDKCRGTGNIPYFNHVEDGVCFQCGGTGVHAYKWSERTPEYEAKLEARRMAKIRAGAEVANTEYLLKFGFNQSGEIWIVLGKTFDIKEELKANGAKFNHTFGWTFSSGAWAYPMYKLTKDTLIPHYSSEGEPTFNSLISQNPNTLLYELADAHDVIDFVKAIQKAYELENKPETKFVGQIGEKIEFVAKLDGLFWYDTQYGTTYIYKFVTEANEVVVWRSGSHDMQRGLKYLVKGTVKEHSSYNDEKQTVVTRCKYEEVK